MRIRPSISEIDACVATVAAIGQRRSRRQIQLSMFFIAALAWGSANLYARDYSSVIELNVYLDPLDYFHYYDSFHFLRKALAIDGLDTRIQSVNKLKLHIGEEQYSAEDRSKIYLVEVYERNVERYREALEALGARSNVILWIITPTGRVYQGIEDFEFDVIVSSPEQSDVVAVFHDRILPQILTIYTRIFSVF